MVDTAKLGFFSPPVATMRRETKEKKNGKKRPERGVTIECEGRGKQMMVDGPHKSR